VWRRPLRPQDRDFVRALRPPYGYAATPRAPRLRSLGSLGGGGDLCGPWRVGWVVRVDVTLVLTVLLRPVLLGGEEEGGVAEFVPEVVVVQGGVVGALDQGGAGYGFEEQEVGGVGVVQAGDQAVDDASGVVGSEG
jgi:hypothetical protein